MCTRWAAVSDGKYTIGTESGPLFNAMIYAHKRYASYLYNAGIHEKLIMFLFISEYTFRRKKSAT